jgi:UDP-glucuronate decarboxylase
VRVSSAEGTVQTCRIRWTPWQLETYWGNVNPIGIRSCYDEGKRCAETLFFDYYRQHALRIKVARIFNTYGPRMQANDGRVVSSFIVQALTGRSLTVFGDGKQTRSFCYVDDLVDGLIRLMDSADDVTGPINLGNPGEFTMLELAEKVSALAGGGGGIEHEPLPQDDPVRRKPDIGLAERELGWAPTVDLDTGLARTVEYFRELLGRQPR